MCCRGMAFVRTDIILAKFILLTSALGISEGATTLSITALSITVSSTIMLSVSMLSFSFF
jgi:hypothetical protein